MKRINIFNLMLVLFVALILVVILSSFIGPVDIPLDRLFEPRFFEILKLRYFRIMLAIAAGAGLSLAGTCLQGVLRNPLAEPYILGVSSGAGLGAVIGLIFLSSSGLTQILAFSCGLLTIILVCGLSRVDNRMFPENMIISGIIVNALFSSLLMFLISSSPGAKVHSIIWWLLGNLQVYNGLNVASLGIVVVASLLVTMAFSKELNALSLGEESAMHLGVDIERIKKIFLFVSALITSVTVSICGIIGFVGLMMPHLTRKIVGPDHRVLIPCSVLAGALFLLLCDTISRVITLPAEIPIGVVTSFIGVPFFVYILRTSKRVYFK